MSEGLLPDEILAEPVHGPSDPLTRLTEIVASIGTVWTFLLMFLIVADVIGRSFLSSPITGVAEVAGNSVVAIVFLQLACAVANKRMTRADFLIERIMKTNPARAHMIEAFFGLVGAGIMGLIAFASWPGVHDAWRTSEFFGVQGLFTIPTWPFRTLIVFGALLAGAVYVLIALKEFALSRAATMEPAR